MNPLDAISALSNLQGQIPASGVNFQPTAAGMPNIAGFNLGGSNVGGAQGVGGAQTIGEGFSNFVPAQQLTVPQISVAPIGISGGASPSTWGHMVQQMVMDVNNQQQSAAQKVADVLQGGPTPVHDAMVASEEASLSFEFLGEARNKIVEAYNQVMQMQV